ncbi:YaiO family outer membrane beta-barrel protein [Luteibaculum oceani]|uniref:YaiO family outer membrane beta-barrel protein n=1 Tax=Luteibaculum oceani TaxID=1294296 RepID=A0A5C6VB39_9FLAO|nr:YaiO family outer membrane beta-barrel protein [Luteibaculum oceani]TXC82150.1 YaiO family outer membrane beta-barrel protein [Luteibaculum oceani]
MTKRPSSSISKSWNLTVGLTLCFIILALTGLKAQDGKDRLANRYFEISKTYAYAKTYDSAFVYLNRALNLSPSNLEMRTFKARLHGFTGNFDEGIEVAKGVLRDDHRYVPAYLCLSDLFIWADNKPQALNTVKNGLYFSASNVELLEKKALLEYELGQAAESAETAEKLLYYDPSNDTGQKLRSSLKKEIKRNDAGIIYNLDSYENILGNANALSYYYTRKTGTGPLTIRLNQAIRQGKTGFQLEADWYPRLTKRSYLYLNAGFSASDLFPPLRLGAEYYYNFEKAWEGSIGFRYLQFNQEIRPVLLTGQLGKYFGSNWISGRMFLGFTGVPKVTRSYVFLFRHYYKNPEQWLGLTVAFGFVPEIGTFQNTTNIGIDPESGLPIYLNRTRRIGVSYQQPFNKSWWARLTIGAGQQEMQDFPGIYDDFFWGSIQINHSF